MRRPPCCDKLGVKKGPWTPEEDIMLVSYIQEHGPGNWRAVPTHTGLMRCSKSCRLRWTNYLRPGIKRGNFTDHEEKLIIHLQALLGNRWAAIASYLRERTDNDIKNYWNTHLKKKLNKQADFPTSSFTKAVNSYSSSSSNSNSNSSSNSQQGISKGQWERRLQTDIHLTKQALRRALSLDQEEPSSTTDNHDLQPPMSKTASSTLYVLSTENISWMLEKWAAKSPPPSLSITNPVNSSSGMTPDVSGWSTSQGSPFEMIEDWLFDDSLSLNMIGQGIINEINKEDSEIHMQVYKQEY